MAGKEPPGRPQVRIASDLDAWAGEYAKANGEGLTSKSQVVEQAVRALKERVEKEEMRKQLFRAWVANGRPWPPPPGLDPGHG